MIEKVKKDKYLELISIWESSVRATHDFLDESRILFYKDLIFNTYFDQVELTVIKNKEVIVGFIGISGYKVEMLFISPKYFCKGFGSSLLDWAINKKGIRYIDVNEDNKGAVEFYLKKGFVVIDKSPLDSEGQPYPILHMELKTP